MPTGAWGRDVRRHDEKGSVPLLSHHRACVRLLGSTAMVARGRGRDLFCCGSILLLIISLFQNVWQILWWTFDLRLLPCAANYRRTDVALFTHCRWTSEQVDDRIQNMLDACDTSCSFWTRWRRFPPTLVHHTIGYPLWIGCVTFKVFSIVSSDSCMLICATSLALLLRRLSPA